MTLGVEPTHRIAELTLGALKKIGLPATPQNFELWYAHVERRRPALSRDIQKAIDAFGNVSQDDADKLYQSHIQHLDMSRDVIALVTRFQSEVASLYDIIEQTGDNAAVNNETLSGISSKLQSSSDEFPAVGKLLENVIAVAKNMHSQNSELESRLAESTDEISNLQRNVESIQAEAMKDSLTGIPNRSLFDKTLDEMMADAAADGSPLALVLADIDHFKNFNDTWGHVTGDQVLRLVAEVMSANVKGQDMLARYGGEEFAVILPDTSQENARMLADRIRKAVESRRLKKRRTDEDLGTVTMSMGVSMFRPGENMEDLIERADKGLYAAKEAGRNQVIDERDLERTKNAKPGQAGAA